MHSYLEQSCNFSELSAPFKQNCNYFKLSAPVSTKLTLLVSAPFFPPSKLPLFLANCNFFLLASPIFWCKIASFSSYLCQAAIILSIWTYFHQTAIISSYLLLLRAKLYYLYLLLAKLQLFLSKSAIISSYLHRQLFQPSSNFSSDLHWFQAICVHTFFE